METRKTSLPGGNKNKATLSNSRQTGRHAKNAVSVATSCTTVSCFLESKAAGTWSSPINSA